MRSLANDEIVDNAIHQFGPSLFLVTTIDRKLSFQYISTTSGTVLSENPIIWFPAFENWDFQPAYVFSNEEVIQFFTGKGRYECGS